MKRMLFSVHLGFLLSLSRAPGSRGWDHDFRLNARKHFLDLSLCVREVFYDCALACRSWIFLLFPRDRAMIMFWVPHRFVWKSLAALPGPYASLIPLEEVLDL